MLNLYRCAVAYGARCGCSASAHFVLNGKLIHNPANPAVFMFTTLLYRAGLSQTLIRTDFVFTSGPRNITTGFIFTREGFYMFYCLFF